MNPDAIPPDRSESSQTRPAVWLACAVAGLALAAVAWWFVPSGPGLSRSSAQHEADRQAAELRALPSDDLSGREPAALGEHPPAQEQLLASRRQAILARLEAGRQGALLEFKRHADQGGAFQAAAAFAERLKVELGEEARAV